MEISFGFGLVGNGATSMLSSWLTVAVVTAPHAASHTALIAAAAAAPAATSPAIVPTLLALSGGLIAPAAAVAAVAGIAGIALSAQGAMWAEKPLVSAKMGKKAKKDGSILKRVKKPIGKAPASSSKFLTLLQKRPCAATEVKERMLRTSVPSCPVPPELDGSDVVDMLGGGAFGTVYKVLDPSTKEDFALKVAPLRPSVEHQARQECRALKVTTAWQVPHVVKFWEGFEDSGCIYIFMECCSGPLSPILPVMEVHKFGAQLLRALCVLHDIGLVHRDIKPGNLLVKSGALRVADFGWCCLLEDEPSNLAGTPAHMAPEVLGEQAQTAAGDVWSTACTLVELLTGTKLFGEQMSCVLEEIRCLCGTSRPPASGQPHGVSLAHWRIISCMLDVRPAERLCTTNALDVWQACRASDCGS
eukprot:s2970_g5.t1